MALRVTAGHQFSHWLAGGAGWLVGGEHGIPAERAAVALPIEQAQRVAVQRGFDASPPGGPVPGQGGVVGGRRAVDRLVPDDVCPGELDEMGDVTAAADEAAVTEDPPVVPELVELAEVAADRPDLRLVRVAVFGPLVGELPHVGV